MAGNSKSFMIVVVVAIAAIGIGVYLQGSLAPAKSTPISTQQEVVYPSWIKIENWFTEQIVKIEVVRLDTGKSYEANFAVPAYGKVGSPEVAYVAFPIPINTAYKVTVTTGGGHSVWWNSVYLQINAQNEAPSLAIAKNPDGYESSGNLQSSTWANVLCIGNN